MPLLSTAVSDQHRTEIISAHLGAMQYEYGLF